MKTNADIARKIFKSLPDGVTWKKERGYNVWRVTNSTKQADGSTLFDWMTIDMYGDAVDGKAMVSDHKCFDTLTEACQYVVSYFAESETSDSESAATKSVAKTSTPNQETPKMKINLKQRILAIVTETPGLDRDGIYAALKADKHDIDFTDTALRDNLSNMSREAGKDHSLVKDGKCYFVNDDDGSAPASKAPAKAPKSSGPLYFKSVDEFKKHAMTALLDDGRDCIANGGRSFLFLTKDLDPNDDGNFAIHTEVNEGKGPKYTLYAYVKSKTADPIYKASGEFADAMLEVKAAAKDLDSNDGEPEVETEEPSSEAQSWQTAGELEHSVQRLSNMVCGEILNPDRETDDASARFDARDGNIFIYVSTGVREVLFGALQSDAEDDMSDARSAVAKFNNEVKNAKSKVAGEKPKSAARQVVEKEAAKKPVKKVKAVSKKVEPEVVKDAGQVEKENEAAYDSVYATATDEMVKFVGEHLDFMNAVDNPKFVMEGYDVIFEYEVAGHGQYFKVGDVWDVSGGSTKENPTDAEFRGVADAVQDFDLNLQIGEMLNERALHEQAEVEAPVSNDLTKAEQKVADKAVKAFRREQAKQAKDAAKAKVKAERAKIIKERDDAIEAAKNDARKALGRLMSR